MANIKNSKRKSKKPRSRLAEAIRETNAGLRRIGLLPRKRKWKDPDDAPALTREFFRTGNVYVGDKLVRRGRPPVGARLKEAVKLRLSPDVLDHFRAGGPGWQTRINATLERAVVRERRRGR